MTEKRMLLDPTSELAPEKRARLQRPARLEGLTVGLLDISKARGNVFLDQVEALLCEQGLAVKRYQKPTFTRIAPTAVKQAIAQECHVVIEALAD